MEKIEDSARFLRDTGLLFEINRRILHPLGLSLAVKEDDTTGEITLDGVLDGRFDPEGFVFDNPSFKTGEERFSKFSEEFALDRMEDRLKRLGFIVQGETPCDIAIQPNEPSI